MLLKHITNKSILLSVTIKPIFLLAIAKPALSYLCQNASLSVTPAFLVNIQQLTCVHVIYICSLNIIIYCFKSQNWSILLRNCTFCIFIIPHCSHFALLILCFCFLLQCILLLYVLFCSFLLATHNLYTGVLIPSIVIFINNVVFR